MIEHEAQFTAHNPTFVRQSLPANLLFAASFSTGMDEFHAVGVNQPNEAGVSHEMLGQMAMSVEEPEQASAMGQFRKQSQVIPYQPAVKGSIAHPFEGKQDSNGHDFTGVELALDVLSGIGHSVINAAKQFSDEIYGRHEFLLYALRLYTHSIGESHDFAN